MQKRDERIKTEGNGFKLPSIRSPGKKSPKPLRRQRSRSFDDKEALEQCGYNAKILSSPRSLRSVRTDDECRSRDVSTSQSVRISANALASPICLQKLRSNSFDDLDETEVKLSPHQKADTLSLPSPKSKLLSRQRSRSFDDIRTRIPDDRDSPTLLGMSTSRRNIPPLPSITQPTIGLHPLVNQLYDGTKVFWKCRVTVRLWIFYHVQFECFEVVNFNYRDNKDMGRLYVLKSTLEPYIERGGGLRDIKVRTLYFRTMHENLRVEYT